jgi:hypothetical protein
MTSLLLVLALFAVWALVGLALLSLVQADTYELRVALTAPAIGTCVTAIVAFLFSEAGVALDECAVPITIVLALGSILIVSLRRPALHPGVVAVAIVCVGGLLLAAWPMFSLGFGWLGNGNDDMTNYVLSAQDLLQHGLLSPVDLKGLAQGRDYATVLSGLHLAGTRPGSDIVLAFVSRIAGRPPYQTFMVLILAFNLCTASAVGALAMQVVGRWWTAVVAAGLLLVSPLATFGALQQLLAQVWGLGLVAALFALLMRPELHGGQGPRVRDVVPIGVLTAGLVLGYFELIPTMGLAYAAYVGLLAARRQLSVAALARLWLPGLAIAVVLLNGYFFTELGFLRGQVTHGLGAASYPPLFGYILVPSALPGVVGLQTLPPVDGAPYLNLTIVLAALALLAVLVASVASARRGVAAAIVLVVEAALAILLVRKNSDFGLFKLSMYAQPFLAATVAIWLSTAARRRWLALIFAALMVGLVVAALSSQRAYVKESQDPVDVPHLSEAGVIPAFHAVATRQAGPLVSVTENPVLIKLEAASAAGHTVYFQSRDVFSPFLKQYAGEVSGERRMQAVHLLRSGTWTPRSFQLLTFGGAHDYFEEDTRAEQSLRAAPCELVIPGGSELPLNRYSLPASSAPLVSMPCGAAHNLLAFTSSRLGESFYLPFARKNISFFQLQQDPFFPDRTMVGFGRYALFRVLGPSRGMHLVIDLTATLTHDAANVLPPAAVVGSTRLALPLQGRGSARVFSPPLEPQVIAGAPYVLLDMGVNGRLPASSRSGVQALYGRSVPTDPRYLTVYVRNISLVSAAQYNGLHPPISVSRFPADLNNPDLEYSGLYEDGWMGADGYVRLAGGPAADLLLMGQVPTGAGKHLEVLVNGRRLSSVAVAPGPLAVRMGVPASAGSRRVEVRFATTIRLKAPDLRPAAVHLSFLGIVPRSRR